MGEVQVATTKGEMRGFDERALDALRSGLRGPLLCSGDLGYEDARKIWNAMVDKRPTLIARCAGAADVRRCVEFAARHSLLVSVRGGGHNVAGNAVCDGGLMVDLSRLKAIRVDPASRAAISCNSSLANTLEANGRVREYAILASI